MDGDVFTLVPVRWFLNKYRLFLLFGLTGVFLLGIALVAAAWWVTPVTRVSSIQLSLGFQGAQDGQYPNRLPFSAEELIDPAVLRVLFERHQLQQWIEYPAFESSLSISQSLGNLQGTLREYSARLSDSKLAGPDRQALEEEYRSRLRSASSTLFTLAWFDQGRAAGVPAEVKAKVLADVPAVWAEQAVRGKQVLIFSSRLPGLNPRVDEGSQAELEAYASIHARARAMEDGLASVEKLPGASQVALPDGTTLIDLKLRLRAFREQTLPALQEVAARTGARQALSINLMGGLAAFCARLGLALAVWEIDPAIDRLRPETGPTRHVAVGTWRRVFEAVAKPMSVHEQWRAIDAAATVELNTRDPLVFGPAHHHLLRDLVNAVIEGEAPDQGISVVALGVRVVIEVSPGGQLIVFAGDEHLAAPVRGVIEHHLRPR